MDIVNKIQLRDIFSKDKSNRANLQKLCKELKDNVDHYDWVGFYIVNEANQTLELGPFAGAPTDHKVIPFGKGVCGESAEKEETIIVPDVSKLDNYLSCSLYVKSEIVVPVFKDDQYIAQLDIDSHDLDPFSDQDREFLEDLCSRLSPYFPLN